MWHRDSIGILIQRLAFSILMAGSIWIFLENVSNGDLMPCLIKTAAPLILVLIIVFFKVLCLR